ncbi:hypothetical protein [Tuwongella immobilis]|uniref:Uncharacterized protein n=1 Tax=Tuwongella immobilis TaxID=692036 RepID=A0A6C2YIU8_9BACT|nr:hypothetical protein [Tuwongella immobilis]VIP01211.1 Uncharacterized protein OS=Cystobacter fuscus DSM 2262 GN=D187_002091 PE=4 SV=1 [Tuwongella immobilis]VTR97848.1 Uncharacterized protein OS=Cystobacter fuscus DSM 2262 GN=D187_002091 PE=4 SV=1 [Tuwongella immobilis]
MTCRIAVVYEADGDFLTGTTLADRVFLEAIDWLESEQLSDMREWVGEIEGFQLKWKTIPRLASEKGIRAHGHFDGGPGAPDAAAARRALLILKPEANQFVGIVLLRDQDHQPERRRGLEQARDEYRGNLKIVIGFAIVEREAWVLSGFVPQSSDEEKRLDDERKNLGFQPHEQSHKLTASKDNTAKLSPKRVWEVLTGKCQERDAACVTETSLDVLRTRGQQNGLAAYLDEVRTHLAPLIGTH